MNDQAAAGRDKIDAHCASFGKVHRGYEEFSSLQRCIVLDESLRLTNLAAGFTEVR